MYKEYEFMRLFSRADGDSERAEGLWEAEEAVCDVQRRLSLYGFRWSSSSSQNPWYETFLSLKPFRLGLPSYPPGLISVFVLKRTS